MVDNFIKYYKKISFFIPFILLFFWITTTLTSANMYNFHADEIWHWHIASSLNFVEIIKLMHYEGHTFLWYLILKPFTHFDNMFPFALKYINWVFMLGSMVLILFFSPFNNFIKILITLSCPFLLVYPVLGRPYGLGIFLLLLLTFFYKHRLKYPILYSILIFLAANTHLLVTIGVGAIACIFIYDLYKYKIIQKIYPLSIILFTIISLILQWLPMHLPDFIQHYDKMIKLKWVLFPDSFVISKTTVLLGYTLLFILILYTTIKKQYLRFTFFLFSSFISLLFCFCIIYFVVIPYFYFFYVYMVIYCWLVLEKLNANNQIHIKTIIITILTLISILSSPYLRNDSHYYNFNYYDYIDTIDKVNAIIPKGSTIYIVLGYELYPMLEKNYLIKDDRGNSLQSYKAVSSMFHGRKLNPHEVNVKKGVKSYYICYKREYNNNEDKRYPKYDVGDSWKNYEIFNISR